MQRVYAYVYGPLQREQKTTGDGLMNDLMGRRRDDLAAQLTLTGEVIYSIESIELLEIWTKEYVEPLVEAARRVKHIIADIKEWPGKHVANCPGCLNKETLKRLGFMDE